MRIGGNTNFNTCIALITGVFGCGYSISPRHTPALLHLRLRSPGQFTASSVHYTRIYIARR